ncbi:TRAP transporter substrate-binding protein DctP [Halomonas mongoliensis]|uniref:TRAP transporter substrate-binding protein DctP n=1 Tax=Halomonas mongoliensis TaxID=321265 RepID=UPI00403ABF60
MRKFNRAGVVVLAMGIAIAAGDAVATTLSYGTYISRTHILHEHSLQPFFEAVEQETDGSLSFRMHSDGTVVGARNTLSGIADGVVDMGLIVDVYIPSEVPAGAILSELALYPSSTMAGSAAMSEMVLLHCDQCREELGAMDVKPMGFYATAPYYLMCRDQVDDLASIRSKRIKSVGAWSGLVAALEGMPTNFSSGEMYEGLSRGAIDCALGSGAWLSSYSVADVVDYVLDMELGAYRGANYLNMHAGKWGALSDTEREAFRKHIPQAVARAAIAYDREAKAALEAAQVAGVQMLDPDQGLQERYQALLEDEIARVIELGERRGVRNAGDLVMQFVALLEKWEAIVADLDGSEEAFAAALDREIYQKAAL